VNPKTVDKILFSGEPLKYEREFSAVFIDFPQTLMKGRVYSIGERYAVY